MTRIQTNIIQRKKLLMPAKINCPLSAEDFGELHISQRLSVHEIADYLNAQYDVNVSTTTVTRWMTRAGVKLRSHRDAVRARWTKQPPAHHPRHSVGIHFGSAADLQMIHDAANQTGKTLSEWVSGKAVACAKRSLKKK